MKVRFHTLTGWRSLVQAQYGSLGAKPLKPLLYRGFSTSINLLWLVLFCFCLTISDQRVTNF